MAINDLRYCCGVLDSESNIELNLVTWNTKKGMKANVRASIRIGMADERTILYLQEQFKCGKIYKSQYKNKKGYIDFYTLILNEKETYEILGELDGQLITKQRDLEIMKLFFAGFKKRSVYANEEPKKRNET